MKKAILVMDMPENCVGCPLSAESSDEYIQYCTGTDDKIDDFFYSKRKPDWCPLKELPERKDDDADYALYDLGWNACIDEILKERD